MKRLVGLAVLFLGLSFAAATTSMAGPPAITCQGGFVNGDGFFPGGGPNSILKSCIDLGGHPIAVVAWRP